MSRRARATGSVLIVLVGLLNFHIPHFLIQSGSGLDDAGRVLEVVFLANVLAAVLAAVGIYRASGWAWLLGLAVVVVSVLLYVLQETVGLPGLPQAWLEPSRIVSLLVEALFACVAWYQLLVTAEARPDDAASGSDVGD